jgi:hypothetical protein
MRGEGPFTRASFKSKYNIISQIKTTREKKDRTESGRSGQPPCRLPSVFLTPAPVGSFVWAPAVDGQGVRHSYDATVPFLPVLQHLDTGGR